MPLPNIDNAYRCIYGFSALEGGKAWSTYIDLLLTDDGGDFDEAEAGATANAALANILDTVYAGSTTIRERLVETITLDKITVYDLGAQSAPVEVTSGLTTYGEATGSQLPPDISIVASCRTAFRGRTGRGRRYFAGWDEGANIDGVMISTLQSALQTAFNTYLAGAITGVGSSGLSSVLPVLISGTPTVTSKEITNWVVNRDWDTQRRRGN